MTVGPQRKKAGMSEESRLKGAVTRAQRSVDRIDMEYGAASIPLDNPLYAKRQTYKEKHQAALKALREHREGRGAG